MKDLFEADGKELFCPLDGGKLTNSKWEWCGFRLLICPKEHVWEVQDMEWGRHKSGYFEFDLEKMAKCQCGQVCPERNMKNKALTVHERANKVCPDCFELFQKAWKPDLEQSHARLVITPVKRKDGVVFTYDEELQIRPYPNPFGCGGMYGGFGHYFTTEDEVEHHIEWFKDYCAEWVELGIKLEIIRKPEMTMAEHINEREYDKIQENPEDASRPAQLHLIA